MAELDRCIAFMRAFDERRAKRVVPFRYGKAYVNDEAGREAAWTRAVAESQRLADEFAAIVERGQPFDPLPL